MIVAVVSLAVALAYFGLGVPAYERRRGKIWPAGYRVAFAAGLASIAAALTPALDRAGDRAFVPHMLQHLILTDLSAPLLLLGAPLLLALGGAPTAPARRVVAFFRSRFMHVLGFPVVTWTLFIVTLWAIHFGGFFEAALEHEPLHLLEHGLYLGTALLFWLPVIAIGPTPWVDGPLAFPMRMLYLLIAMPAEGFLGFALYGSRRVLYSSYAGAGIVDQQSAGEIMWIGSGLAMFAAFMLVAIEWSRHERRVTERADARADRDALVVA